MPKLLPLFLIVTACFTGCATPETPTFINNPRIVERNLAPTAAEPADAPQPVNTENGEVAAGERRQAVERSLAPATAAKAVATAPAAPVAVPAGRWEVRVSDVRLAATFERWAAESAANGQESYKILWDAEKHVLIDATPVYGGNMLDAVEAALSTPAIRRSAYPLEACLYPNTPPLIRITKRGEQTEACPDVKQ